MRPIRRALQVAEPPCRSSALRLPRPTGMTRSAAGARRLRYGRPGGGNEVGYRKDSATGLPKFRYRSVADALRNAMSSSSALPCNGKGRFLQCPRVLRPAQRENGPRRRTAHGAPRRNPSSQISTVGLSAQKVLPASAKLGNMAFSGRFPLQESAELEDIAAQSSRTRALRRGAMRNLGPLRRGRRRWRPAASGLRLAAYH